MSEQTWQPIEALIADWRERARRARPLEAAALTAEKRSRTKEYIDYTNRANELAAALELVENLWNLYDGEPPPAVPGLREQIEKLPRRVEWLGGQQTSYVQLDNVLALLELAHPTAIPEKET